jgi:hypothetical protein
MQIKSLAILLSAPSTVLSLMALLSPILHELRAFSTFGNMKKLIFFYDWITWENH